MIASILLVLAVPSSSAAPAASTIGVAGAVRGAVRAKAPGAAAGRVMETGREVFQNDRVTTDAAGRLQVLLRDETTFTLGPNSDMVLDEFVYDPASGKGKVAATVAKGAFRFVTGKIAQKDSDDMSVKTPVATIGIRGTMVAGRASADETTVVLIGPGRENSADETPGGITVGNEHGSVVIDRSGYATTVKRGQAPVRPFELRGGIMDGLLDELASIPTGAGNGGVEGRAGERSGDDRRRGLGYLDSFLYHQDAAQPDADRYALLSLFNGGPSTWEEVRGITVGQGRYVGSTDYSGPGGAGTMTVGINIDFGARTIGGPGAGGSTIVTSQTTGIVDQFSYDSLSGNAKVNLLPHLSAGSFQAASLQLVNKEGVVAKTAVVDATFNTGFGPSSSATVYADR